VAEFYGLVMDALKRLEIDVHIWPMPVEVTSPIRFDQDLTHASYDDDAAHTLLEVLLAISPVLEGFRGRFVGKCSPVHFFWGSFDLAVTRFSGRPAPPTSGGGSVPNLPESVTRDAYSHEVSSAGFWPGGQGIDYPAFYSYSSPAPPGFSSMPIRPVQAFWSRDLSEYILPYDAVRTAANPEQALMDFLISTYEAAAIAGSWDRAALECPFGVPGIPRKA